jgi:hypothetical protein
MHATRRLAAVVPLVLVSPASAVPFSAGADGLSVRRVGRLRCRLRQQRGRTAGSCRPRRGGWSDGGKRRSATTSATEGLKTGSSAYARNPKASDLRRSEAFGLCGRYWDRTSDLFGVNRSSRVSGGLGSLSICVLNCVNDLIASQGSSDISLVAGCLSYQIYYWFGAGAGRVGRVYWSSCTVVAGRGALVSALRAAPCDLGLRRRDGSLVIVLRLVC